MKASWIIDQLIEQGVHHFCLAPCSRSAPLMQAALHHPQAICHSHFDERGVGFYALGLSKASDTPSVIIVTSGTAVGNLLPAIMEAHHSNTSLIVITADRPHELRHCSANQATDQVKLFSNFVRFQVDLPVELHEHYYRNRAAQSVFYSKQNPPGPVHLNCPFREPLHEIELPIPKGQPIPLTYPTLDLKIPFHSPHSKGLICIGRLPKPSDLFPILDLAKQLSWPIFADLLSNARSFMTPEQVRFFDWIDKPTPDLILHFGERMTSKRFQNWVSQFNPPYIHISPYPPFVEHQNETVQADIPSFCAQFRAFADPNWLLEWKDQEPQFLENGSFTEVHMMRQLAEWIPRDCALFFGNGMPIRDADHFFFPKSSHRYFANRGLSGIDGNIATIAGLAEFFPILAVIGDQAALYDLNSLPLLKKTKYPVYLVVSNNFGGGIFHHLPIFHSIHFETHWAASHTTQFEWAAKLFDLPYLRFNEDLFLHSQSTLIELITDRHKNYEYQKCSIHKY